MTENYMRAKTNFYILMFGRLISGAGSYFNMVALNLFIYVKTGSATLTGLAMSARIFAGLLASPYLGTLADKIDRKKGMIVSDAVLAVSMFTIYFVPEGAGAVVSIFIVQILLGIFQNFFMINFQSAIPHFAPDSDLVKANSTFQLVNCVTVLAGAVGASAAIDFLGYKTAFLIDGASYLVSLLILLALPIVTQGVRAGAGAAKKAGDGFINGARFLIKTAPFIFVIFFVRFLDGVGSGSHNVSLPVFSKLISADNPAMAYGLILAFWSAGSVVGVLWMNSVKKKREVVSQKIFIYSTLIMSVFWIMVFQSKVLLPIAIFATIAGFFDTVASVSYSIILQNTEDEVRGRVMGLSVASCMMGFGGGMAAASIMAEKMGPASLVAFWHGIPIVVILLVLTRSVIARSPKGDVAIPCFWGLLRRQNSSQ